MMMMMIFIQAMHGIPYEPSLSAALRYNERRLYLMIELPQASRLALEAYRHPPAMATRLRQC